MLIGSPLADPETSRLDDLVDVDRYPIADDESFEFLARECADDLARRGVAQLPGFLRSDALSAIADDLDTARAHVPLREHAAGVYHRTDLEDDLAADDPRRQRLTWRAGHVTRDMIPAWSPAQRLYVSPTFKAFIARCVGLDRVFEYADPLAGLVATVLPDGGTYPWHYDTNEFVVTLMIRRPASGGAFEWVHDLRSPGDENLRGLRRVLDGDRREVQESTADPGDLQLFLGRYSLHRVTPVVGDRLVLVLSYAAAPGVIGPVDRTRSVYGRVTEAHLTAAARELGADGVLL